MPSSVMTIRLSQDDTARLANLSEKTHRPKSFYIKEALARYFEDMEDLYLAESAMARIRSGEERTYTLDEVEAKLGLAG